MLNRPQNDLLRTVFQVGNITVDDDEDLSSESELVMKKWQVPTQCCICY